MTLDELYKYADHETQWLRYYGWSESRLSEPFNDHTFYDRLKSIGYTKRVIPLPMRCVAGYVTADVPVLQADVEDLKLCSAPRDHANNVYTALEYVFAKNLSRSDEFRNILKG